VEIAVLIWIACGIVAAIIGSQKGEGIAGFIFGLILGPIGILVALSSSGNRRPCPYCKEMIHRQALACPRCQRDLTTPEAQGLASPAPATRVPAPPIVNAEDWRRAVTSVGRAFARNRTEVATTIAIITGGAILLYMFLAGSPFPSSVQISSAGWIHVRSVGPIDMMLVDRGRATDKNIYLEALAARCPRGSKFCKLLFWSDERLIPTAMPMTDTQVNALLANFTVDHAGSTILWSCHIDPGSQACFR